jgi:CRISPR-associated protein (TIGR03984 family)
MERPMVNNEQLNKVKPIKSWVETGNVKTNVMEFLEETSAKMSGSIFILAHKHHEVLIGTVRDQKVDIANPGQLCTDYLQEMRMFSPPGELYIWNHRGQLKYRLRIDEQGEETNKYDEVHFMWGKKMDEKDDHNTIIEPNRGMRLTFPCALAEKDCPLKYHVRNYLDFDDYGHIRFYDARLITFLKEDGKELVS